MLVKSDFQNVRTTAYTHTESDHRQFSNRNALGGELHAAGPGIRRAENVRLSGAITDSGVADIQLAAYSSGPQPFSESDEPAPKASKKSTTKTTTAVTTKTTTRVTKTTKAPAKRAMAVSKTPKIGSAAADWGRWPAGTTFRLVSTGQIYRVEDYGWALSGRNTIDLYMANQREMNAWGARQEPIQVLHWGDPQDSLRLLVPHQEHKHIKRMMLELQGREQDAAALQ
jgi:3D (Asp-Asp-Asp) domain-containing protein